MADLGAKSLLTVSIVRAEPVVVVAAPIAPVVGRSALVTECPVVFGWAAVVPPPARGNGSRFVPGVVDAAVGMLPPLRSDLDRALDGGCVPVGGENCGRKTDSVRLLPSNCSPRAPCLAVEFASRMATL